MGFLSIVLGYIPYAIVLLVIIGGAVAFFKGEKRSLQNVLLYLCGEAEKIFGSKTGQLKLKYVWSQACSQFKFLTTFMTFEKFSEMVDQCLVDFRHLVETNPNIAGYIGVEDNNIKGDE